MNEYSPPEKIDYISMQSVMVSKHFVIDPLLFKWDFFHKIIKVIRDILHTDRRICFYSVGKSCQLVIIYKQGTDIYVFYLTDFNHYLVLLYYSVCEIINFNMTTVFVKEKLRPNMIFSFCGTVQSTWWWPVSGRNM